MMRSERDDDRQDRRGDISGALVVSQYLRERSQQTGGACVQYVCVGDLNACSGGGQDLMRHG